MGHEVSDIAPFKRVFIANRGEIAIRIAKAATTLGMESVGVYAAVDAGSLHTRYTTENREIGSSAGDQADPVSAYLDIEALVDAAKATGCDCVHPGYGFLSENAEFASRCEAEGVTFIGPSPEALILFGDKVRARALAKSIDITVVDGSDELIESATEAQQIAREIGYPVMLKAAAGGGGRGMRFVEKEAEMSDAFERCQSEANAAFGNPSLFLEKRVANPRHIEVQVLGDSKGNLVHLHERDCSVQLRNQKVIEIAPAPDLDPGLRERILIDAIKLARAGKYTNAGTVEFLVVPETEEYFFIECNPRIQVEHTVTEQVTGIDLVEAQFRVAAGDSLDAMGLATQQEVGPPNGFAVQARVVVTSPGTITAYKEPSGVGVRVDSSGYQGYAVRSQFDPLLAKVIGSSNGTGSYPKALVRTLHALQEFHIGGVGNNLQQLVAILSHETVRAGDARTTLLADEPNLRPTIGTSMSPALALFESKAMRADVTPSTEATPMPDLDIPEGGLMVTSTIAGHVVEVSVGVGDLVAVGDALFVLSAMKMETMITAPCDGVVACIQPLSPGDVVAADQTVAVITPAAGSASTRMRPGDRADETWSPVLEAIDTLQALATERLAPGSEDPGVVRQRSRGKLTCRERITLLLDDDSFREVGSVAGFASYDDEGEIVDFTPANHVGGWGKIHGRTAIVCADDFTSRGGHADGAIGAKSGYLDRLSLEMRAPSVRLLDGSSGGGSVAAMVPAQKKEGESTAKESRGAIKAGRPRVSGGG
ncbi:MAG: biotin carboxylase N-terminal domain-containing protein, partial [Pseudomonadota bacterium]|nr:biotin carboxylase N-terminal domain-containing protein [Pseudomonadota bacterium]